MKGQISLESLLLFLIFLSLLGVSLAASNRISAAAQSRIAYEKSASDFQGFAANLKSACVLGNGNVRVVELKGGAALLAADGKSLVFAAGNFSSQLNSSCELAVIQPSTATEFTIENKGGKIEIS